MCVVAGASKKKKAKSKDEGRSTIFDDVFRTMAQKLPFLLVPLINEIFGTDYPEDVKIDQLRNEHFELKGEIITDAIIRIEGVLYHIESQSSNDNTMCIRMFEYDTAIAVEAATKANRRKDVIEIDYPDSCVIYVRSNSKTPDRLCMKVNFPTGESVMYESKTVKVSDYSKEEMITKNLLLMIPFYLVRVEEQVDKIAGSKEKTDGLLEECERLRQLLDERLFDKKQKLYEDLIKLINEVANHVFRSQGKLRKGVEKVMNGRLLTLPSERMERKIKRAEKEGGNLKVYELVSQGDLKPIAGARSLGITVKELKRKMLLLEYKFPEE